MEDYNSRHTGPVIDDAVDRAKVGGALDQSLSEKAPAGYGLGENFPNAISDCNNATRNGWYRTTDTTTNIPPNGPSGGGGALFVVTGQYNWTLIQYFFFGTQGYPGIVCQRKCVTSSWSDWEYVNPPMVLGQEYRTTERYNGKPVYTCLIDCGVISADATKQITHNKDATAVLRICGMRSNGDTVPTVYKNGDRVERIELMASPERVMLVAVNSTTTDTITAQMWYIKD